MVHAYMRYILVHNATCLRVSVSTWCESETSCSSDRSVAQRFNSMAVCTNAEVQGSFLTMYMYFIVFFYQKTKF